MKHLLILVLALSFLVGCNGASRTSTPSASSGAAERQPIAESVPSTSAGTTDANPSSEQATISSSTPASVEVPADGDTVTWEGLQISVPAGASFDRATVAAPAAYGLSMLDAAHVIVPDTTGVARAKAQFLLLEFDGTIDDWLTHINQHQQPQSVGSLPLMVDPASVRQLTIANQPAISYRLQQGDTIEAVEHSALKLAPDRLLVITALEPTDPTTQQIITQLQPTP